MGLQVQPRYLTTVLIWAKSQATLAKFNNTYHKILQWHNHLACCVKSQGDCYERDRINSKIIVVVMENYIQYRNYTMAQFFPWSKRSCQACLLSPQYDASSDCELSFTVWALFVYSDCHHCTQKRAVNMLNVQLWTINR